MSSAVAGWASGFQRPSAGVLVHAVTPPKRSVSSAALKVSRRTLFSGLRAAREHDELLGG